MRTIWAQVQEPKLEEHVTGGKVLREGKGGGMPCLHGEKFLPWAGDSKTRGDEDSSRSTAMDPLYGNDSHGYKSVKG